MRNSGAKATDDDEEELSSSVIIPLDIVFSEIFTRLPVKSLFRFRCVSESVRSLTLNNPSFLDLHLSCSQFRPGATTLLISAAHGNRDASNEILSAPIDGGRATHLLTLPRPHSRHYYYDYYRNFSHHVNGLLCLTHSDTHTYICNPSIRQLAILPNAPSSSRGRNTENQHVSYFLGYDPSTRNFKVLNIHIYNQNSAMVCWVYTLDGFGGGHGGSWRIIHPSLPFDGYCWLKRLRKCVCLNGAMHWLYRPIEVIVVFDLKDENFRVIPLPDCVVLPDSPADLIQLNGFLAVICYKWAARMIEMWVLEDYQIHAWIKHIIDFSTSSSEYKYVHCQSKKKKEYRYFRPVGSLPNGEIILLPFPNRVSDTKVVYYDMKKRSSRIIQITELDKWFSSEYTDLGCVIMNYTESLFSLGGMSLIR